MTIRINLPDAASVDAVAQRFADHDAVRQAVDLATNTQPSLSFDKLYGYANGETAHNDEVEQALENNARLRADLRILLAKVAINHLPEVAAASSGEIEVRETDQCRIRMEPSRAEPDQIYLIVELTDQAAPLPRVLFTCTSDDRSARIDLPKGRNGVIQVLIDRTAPIVNNLRDHNAEVYLR